MGGIFILVSSVSLAGEDKEELLAVLDWREHCFGSQ
jgi:hypothetical protein